MVRRETFEGSVRRLSSIGFKILLDFLASSPRPLQVKEIPYHFRERHSGESKLDALIGWEYLMLLADKVVGHIIPIRFLVFALVGALGLAVHLAVLWFCLNTMQLTFELSQAAATGIAIIGNFTLNNWLTYHDRRLIGWRFVRGLLSFVLIYSFVAIANVGIATLLFTHHHSYWWVAAAGRRGNEFWCARRSPGRAAKTEIDPELSSDASASSGAGMRPSTIMRLARRIAVSTSRFSPTMCSTCARQWPAASWTHQACRSCGHSTSDHICPSIMRQGDHQQA